MWSGSPSKEPRPAASGDSEQAWLHRNPFLVRSAGGGNNSPNDVFVAALEGSSSVWRCGYMEILIFTESMAVCSYF